MNAELAQFFVRMAGLSADGQPHPWQLELASRTVAANQLIRIPTGMGKTHGVLAAWLWNRVQRRDPSWPRRLVWCLPMRVLVEQITDEIRLALRRLDEAAANIDVHALMGGASSGPWQMHPERDAVLVGTQDMLLSRALNRGYGAGRARWPMEFGLLNHDCLWVMDEVQLMDVGLATSSQLQAFREDEANKAVRPCKTWWMSATLQPQWLQRSPDTVTMVQSLLSPVRVAPAERLGPLWEAVRKPLRVETHALAKQVAALVVEQHQAAGCGATGPTLVVLNTVRRALEVHDEIQKLLRKLKSANATELRLVHSRFRPAERTQWRADFLSRQACGPGTDRIVVATQVIEAGVDMSSALLVTDLAPWPSLVQRFGRAARWGGVAQVIVIDSQARDDKAAAPYTQAELAAAAKALALLLDVSPRNLEAFEEQHAELIPDLYPYHPAHVLLRQEVDDLFDTAPDLSGSDIDISRYIRTGEERDVQVFWRLVAPKTSPGSHWRASRDELCAVPFLAARDWLCIKDKRKPDVRAWVWDWLSGQWRLLEAKDIFPGQTLLVAAEVGGYDPQRGWDPKAAPELTSLKSLAEATAGPGVAADSADDAESDESLSATAQWQTIAFHGLHVGRQARALAQAMVPQLADIFDLAGRWHDAGKAHPAFQGSIKPHTYGQQIAKAPKDAWHSGGTLYRLPDGSQRAGFRHELASTLALLALLRRCWPDHPALLGPWRELLARIGQGTEMPPGGLALEPEVLNPLEQEVLALSADDFDLLLYLVCSHHGKVRMSWQASPADQSCHDTHLRVRGVSSGDMLPAFSLAGADGQAHLLPATELVLAAAAVGLNPHTGRGWTERVLGLLARHGPFTLAWLEALMRAADQRASVDVTLADPAVHDDVEARGCAGNHPSLTSVTRSGEAPPTAGQHPTQRGTQHGARRRAGGSVDARRRTRAPAHAIRYLETRLGRLSYVELEPYLARAAVHIEADIEAGQFDDRALDAALIQDLQRRLCAHLTPQLAEWRRVDVLAGSHTPPPHQISLLMTEYALELQARIDSTPTDSAGIFELLAFAEGRLLSIHPFADFNGRTCRLFLRLLLRRLDLHDIGIVPNHQYPEAYSEALRAGDQRDWQALAALWKQRVELKEKRPAS